MKIGTYQSDKIKVLSLFAIILVLYIHSGFHADELNNVKFISYIQEFISGMLGRCAVPLFYAISGYLFFYAVPEGMKSIREKMIKRFNTLFIPYIISAVFFVLFGALVAVIPGTSRFMNSSVLPLFDENVSDIMLSVFYGKNGAPLMAFHLWFLRDLIILVILSPLWYFLYKYLRWYWLIPILFLNYLDIKYFPVYPLLWFGIGGALVKVKMDRNATLTGIGLFILFLSIGLAQLLYHADFWKYFQIPVIGLGLAAIWLFYDNIVPATFKLNNHALWSLACSFTFFVYLYHEPALNIVRKLIVFFLGENEIGYTISYLLSPWIFLVSAVLIGFYFKKVFPKIYEVMVGGR